jgi:nitrogen regulatory protein PII
MQVEVVVSDSMADEAVKAIVQSAQTGEIGRTVFILPVGETYRSERARRRSVRVRPACRI